MCLPMTRRGRICVMRGKNRVLVLASTDAPQFAMLNELPHTICNRGDVCAQAAEDATVILQWSGAQGLLRALWPMCRNVRWVHSMAAGVDKLLFPELVESEVPLTNGRGVFSASLG